MSLTANKTDSHRLEDSEKSSGSQNLDESNDDDAASRFIQEKIALALSQKSLDGTGLTTLKLINMLTNEIIDWKENSKTDGISYSINFDIDEKTYNKLNDLLGRSLSNESVRCCSSVIVGFNQEDPAENLFIFTTGIGMPQSHGVGNASDIRFYTGCNADELEYGFGSLPNENQVFPCSSEPTSFYAVQIEPGTILTNLCGKVKVVRRRGYCTDFSGSCGFIPVCRVIHEH